MSENQLSLPQQDAPLATVSASPMQLLQMAIQAGRGADELERLSALYERWEALQAQREFSAALTGFQAECPIIEKTRLIDLGGGKGPKYASLDDIMVAIRPLLSKHGLSVTFSATLTDHGQLTAVCRVGRGQHLHESEITLPVPEQMRVNDTQKMGAAMSYAKRYAICAALNIVVGDEDRDGAGLMQTIADDDAMALKDILERLEEYEPGCTATLLEWAGCDNVFSIPLDKAERSLGRAKAKLASYEQ